MTPDPLRVELGTTFVGTIANLPGDDNLFSFATDYLDDEERPVLSQAYIGSSGLVRRVPRTHRVAPPFFANLLPDERSILRSLIAKQHGIQRTRDFPYLTVLGEDLPGAVVIRGTGLDGGELDPGGTNLSDDRPLRFSLTGAQLKFSASALERRLTIPLSGIGGSWIVKLPSNAYRRLPENEHAVMSLAAAIGLDVPEIRLIPLDEIDGLPRDLPALRVDEPRLAYAIRRFDRIADGSRIHGEDFNQIADAKPEDKYEGKASHWIASVTHALCPADDVDAMVRRLVFGVCIGNNDMHLKNWGVIYPNGRDARLAPLYDYVCTRAYYPNGSLALTIGEEREFERIDRAALARFARRAEISVNRTLVLANEVVERLRLAWRAAAQTIADATFVAAVERHFAGVPLMAGR